MIKWVFCFLTAGRKLLWRFYFMVFSTEPCLTRFYMFVCFNTWLTCRSDWQVSDKPDEILSWFDDLKQKHVKPAGQWVKQGSALQNSNSWTGFSFCCVLMFLWWFIISSPLHKFPVELKGFNILIPHWSHFIYGKLNIPCRLFIIFYFILVV